MAGLSGSQVIFDRRLIEMICRLLFMDFYGCLLIYQKFEFSFVFHNYCN